MLYIIMFKYEINQSQIVIYDEKTI